MLLNGLCGQQILMTDDQGMACGVNMAQTKMHKSPWEGGM